MNAALLDHEEEDAGGAPKDGDGEGDERRPEGPVLVVAVGEVVVEGGRAHAPADGADANEANDDGDSLDGALELPVAVDTVELVVEVGGLFGGRRRGRQLGGCRACSGRCRGVRCGRSREVCLWSSRGSGRCWLCWRSMGRMRPRGRGDLVRHY